MCFTGLIHILHISIFLFIFYPNHLYYNNLVYSSIPKSSEEIKNIFHGSNVSKHSYNSILKEIVKNGNFSEGGVINANAMTTSLTKTTESVVTNKQNENLSTHRNSTLNPSSTNNHVSNKVKDDAFSQISKPVVHYKLNDSGANLFLGVPEVIHINGTSSVKPRKGVYYNKIVPRKGVDNDSETNHSLSTFPPCFWITEEECYSALNFNQADCNCCNKGNHFGNLIQLQPLLNCNSCKHLQSLPLGDKVSCQNICCKNKELEKEFPLMDHITKNPLKKNVLKIENKKQALTEIKKAELKISQTHSINEEFSKISNLSRKLKLKPSITKVPYDVEIVTELLSKDKKDIFVPVIVSIFLIPLLGIIMLFIWRRTKEYWDKRYYKRMDFLIDGMYND